MKYERRWQDWANVVLGVWLILSPAILGYAEAGTLAAPHSYAIGIAIAAFALAALYRFYRWEEGVNLALGLWLIAAPFVLGFSHIDAAAWNHVIVGVLVALDALMVLMRRPQDTHHRVTSR